MTLYQLNTQKIAYIGATIACLSALLTPALTLLSQPDFILRLGSHDPRAIAQIISSVAGGALAVLGVLLTLVGRAPTVKDDVPGALFNPTAAPPQAGAKGKAP
jgi:hypothetical protein